MKNILITSTTRDNLGTAYSFISDINNIKDVEVKKMIENCIKGIEWKSQDNNYWTSKYNICGSEKNGYIFNDYPLITSMLPITIEHIVNYVFE